MFSRLWFRAHKETWLSFFLCRNQPLLAVKVGSSAWGCYFGSLLSGKGCGTEKIEASQRTSQRTLLLAGISYRKVFFPLFFFLFFFLISIFLFCVYPTMIMVVYQTYFGIVLYNKWERIKKSSTWEG